ncbi:MAG: hypothetical protein E5X89_12515 [Mesorhizobium sp.]|nr:MAG: hypothetical protein E5X88_07050 [Mesorhizobium sp.]TIO34127.1 MAG: hypothetical protein E5X89_12515 [Mesorhizobium sp.]TIP11824.1 MAG: hypothetical protein E5X73_14620 [Mesorhizobium sp.]
MMPACERRFPALPVLTDPNVRSVRVLGPHPVWSLRARLRLRLGLTRISTYPRASYLKPMRLSQSWPTPRSRMIGSGFSESSRAQIR